MKRVVIVNCFDTYEDRIDLIRDFFVNQGHEVTVIQSDFRHFKKVHRKDQKQGFIFIESKPYSRNLSVARLTSHYNYAKKAFKVVEKIRPDLLYVIIPPNSLAKFGAQYKCKDKNVKLIFDLIDLWPETMPIGNIKKIPPFIFWGMMRDKSLSYADLVITECDLYKEVLDSVLKDVKSETLYLAKSEINVTRNPQLSETEINLAYLGSINNIIDINKIRDIIKEIRNVKPVRLHIIGDGESTQMLINEVESVGATVEYHGKIYNPQKKQDIFDKCHFGLNIMKDSVCVGLTMKSIDYFQHGLPIINNIKSDSAKIVEKYQVGINLNNNNKISSLMIEELTRENILKFRLNTSKLYKELFSVKVFNEKLGKLINKVM